MSEQTKVNKLNSIVVLANLYGVEPETVKIAEDEGKLEELHTKFTTSNKILNQTEQIQFEKNLQKTFIDSMLSENGSIPSDIYNKAKGASFQKLERELKRDYDYEGDATTLKELLQDIISKSSKQPNESKADDIVKIKELQKQLEDIGGVAQQNLEFKNQILQHDENLKQKLAEKDLLYQTNIIEGIKRREISKINFADNDNEYTKTLLEKGFENDLNNRVEFKMNENMDWVAIDKQTNATFKDKVGSPLTPSQVIKDLVETLKVPLKVIKQGANITSTNGNQALKNKADANKYIAENNVQGLQAQIKVHAELPVNK